MALASAAVTAFRSFAHHVREPSAYFPIATELKGASNLLISTTELAIGQCMKYSQAPRFKALSTRHLERGMQGIQLAFTQLIPGLIVTVGVLYLARAYQIST